MRIAAFGAWASARSLFTFCVSKKEIGKIYASVGIVASIIPFASNPAFRQLYNHVRFKPLFHHLKNPLIFFVLFRP